MVEEVKAGGVREVADLDSFLSQAIAAVVTAWTANGEELSHSVASYTAALQHLKLPELHSTTGSTQ